MLVSYEGEALCTKAVSNSVFHVLGVRFLIANMLRKQSKYLVNIFFSNI